MLSLIFNIYCFAEKVLERSVMKSEDSTKSSVGRKMCKLKLYAIERAVYTDFCFLVGPNKDEAEVTLNF